MRVAGWLVLLVACAVRGGVAAAEDPPAGAAAPSAVPLLSGLVLDGLLDEPAWAQALRVAADTVSAPPPPPGSERSALTPDVRLAQCDGRLWIGVAVEEDPGMSIGLRVLLGPDALETAGEALALGYAPQEIRAPRYVIRGERGGSRRDAYRVEGATDTRRRGRWSLELTLPLADLRLADPAGVLRLALAVTTRTPNVVAAVPVGALFASPASWLRVRAADGPWNVTPGPDLAALGLRLAEQERLDEERLAAWRQFHVANLEVLPEGPPQAIRARLTEALLPPLRQIEVARPDLKPWVSWIKGDLAQRMGDAQGAERYYGEALSAMPGCREAAFQLYVKLLSQALAEGLPDQPTDYEAALSRVAGDLRLAESPYAREGAQLARALLLYKQGEFVQAAQLLAPLAARYPSEALMTLHLERATAYAEAWPAEQQRRRMDDERGTLPRVRLVTPKGAILLELFEDDAPNTVQSFVWLVDHGFYDGLAFHRNVPFFVLQGGDPFTRAGADAQWVGGGGPGYAIATEDAKRPPVRGVIAMASSARDTEGSQFFLTTGTAAHLEGTVTVFGRILEGQAVAEALVEGDRVEQAETVRRRPGTVYRPVALDQQLAPEPTPTPPVR